MATEEQILDNLSTSISTWNNRLMMRSVSEAVEANIPLERIVTDGLGKGMEKIGQMFDDAKIYLSQVVAAAKIMEAALNILNVGDNIPDEMYRGVVVMGSVQGDIHDIGKNIVKLLLENYGFDVVDLGKDVAPERILEEVVARRAPLVGLSALMTTTVPAMEETIRLLKDKAPWCKTVVGGAVLTQEYADRIGADKYAADAMATVRYAEEVVSAAV